MVLLGTFRAAKGLVEWGFAWSVAFWFSYLLRYCVVPQGVHDHAARWLSRIARERLSRPRLVAGRYSPWRGKLDRMSRNPFTYDRDAGMSGRDESSEFGFGPGMFPDPRIDYTNGGAKSRIPIADPDSDDQLLQLAQIKRTDVSDPNDVPSPYVAGNTDRYGAAPPLVRERRNPTAPPRPRYTRPHMERQW